MSSPSEAPEKTYRLAIRRPVTIAMLFLTLAVFGVRSYQKLPLNLMPDISYPALTVRTEYEGAAPEDVEKLVTRPLEEMLSIVSGMVEISSISSAGRSDIVLEFTWDTDMNTAQQEVRDRLDLFDAPQEITEKPVILRYDPTLDPVIRIAIAPGDTGLPLSADETKDRLTSIRNSAERHLKGDLEAEKGIAQAAIKGGQEEEIQVLVDAVRLKSLGLDLSQVVTALAQQNINLSGGRLQEGKTEYLVRTLNEYQTVDEIAETLIATAQGQVRLRDVAEVFLGVKDRESVVRINGQEAVAIEIHKEGDANTVEVCNRVKDLLGIKRSLGIGEIVVQAYRDAAAGRHPNEKSTSAETANIRGRTMLDRLPKGVALTVISDQSRFINGAINEVQDAAVLGGFLALVVLFLFLRELKATLIIGVAIPISVVTAFIPMFLQHISLNIMSLGGLALGVGMLVDDAIVVLESIFRCKEEGDGVVDAAERGAKEVSSAVSASTFTTVCVFLPIAFVEGIAGQLFGDLALTVTFSLLASLLAALYLIPLIASRQGLAPRAGGNAVWMTTAYREARKTHGIPAALAAIPFLGLKLAAKHLRQSARDTFGPSFGALRAARSGFKAFAKAFIALVVLPLLATLFLAQIALEATAVAIVTPLFLSSLAALALIWATAAAFRLLFWVPLTLFDLGYRAFRNVYVAVLRRSLAFSPLVLLLTGVLAFHAADTALGLGRELLPPMKQGEFNIRLEMRAGSRIEETEARAIQIAATLQEETDVDSVTVEIGQEKSDTSQERGENIAQFTVLLRDPKHTARIQDAIIERLRTRIQGRPGENISFSLPTLFTFKTAVELQIVGDDLEKLKAIAAQALERINAVPGLTDLESSAKAGYPEVIVTLDRELLASKGIAPEQVAARIRTEVQGEVATRFSRAGEKVDIRVRTSQDMLQSVEDLRQLSVSGGPVPIPLAQVAGIELREGPSEIRRIDQRQVVLITGNVEGRDLGAASDDMMAAVAGLAIPEGYYFLPGGQYRELDTSYRSLRFALILAIFLVYVVMACQFESIIHPIIVMFSAPLAFIGVVYALVWAHIGLSIMVFLGGIILAGIVVNDAIVLVDYINQLRARGLAKTEAIVLAGGVRLRPILMTTITTVLGLLPMIVSSGEGAEMRRPMAITVMAGLTSATLLTLLIIPMAYHLFGGRDRAAPPEKEAP